MPQSRFVLKDEVLEVAEELLELTRLSNISELTSILYSRYGKHLKATWEVQPAANIASPEPTHFPSEPIAAFSDLIDL